MLTVTPATYRGQTWIPLNPTVPVQRQRAEKSVDGNERLRQFTSTKARFAVGCYISLVPLGISRCRRRPQITCCRGRKLGRWQERRDPEPEAWGAIASAPRPFNTGPEPQLCTSIERLAEMYDAFTLDQYGVMHDGRNAYDGAAECLERLHKAGKRTIILSNYAGRAELQRNRLPNIGLDPSYLDDVVTSGELAYQYLKRSRAKLGSRVLWIAWKEREKRGLANFFDGLEDYTLVSNVEDADFVLVSGVQAIYAGTSKEIITTYEEDGIPFPFGKLLRAASKRGLPMLCANPDLRVVRPGGWRAYLGGSLAAFYADRCYGRVIYFGKPYNAAFEEARRIMDSIGVSGRICHVGDSLHHDVAGAVAAGFDAAFITNTGLHAEDLPKEPTARDVMGLCERQKTPLPSAVVPRFVW